VKTNLILEELIWVHTDTALEGVHGEQITADLTIVAVKRINQLMFDIFHSQLFDEHNKNVSLRLKV
jgi:hypothetical protein